MLFLHRKIGYLEVASLLKGLQRERQGLLDYDSDALVVHGFRPDYGSGPHMLLMAAVVSLARRDMSNPLYSAECRSFLTGNLVATFAECLGYEGSFLDARTQ